ncbi:hypothetical protein B0H13DRAFT_2127126, partial [Mycena leptocephala]
SVWHSRGLFSTSRGWFSFYCWISNRPSLTVFSIPRTPLPEPPPPSLASPFASVQSITEAVIDRYMLNLILTDGALERSARTVPMLGKKFRFLRGRAATNFMAGVVDFARQEKHEPRITMLLGQVKQHVLVRMHTTLTLGDTEELSGTNDKYVASRQALPLPPLLLQPDVPDRDRIRRLQDSKIPRAANTIHTICTNAHFDAFLRPLYTRGWHAMLLPIVGEDKLYVPMQCLTGFFRFTDLTAAIAFIRDVVGYPWYKEDKAELHFLVDAQTVWAQLLYPPEHVALTVGNLRAAWHIEQIFHDDYLGSARISDVYPYRNHGTHQPGSVEELRCTREAPSPPFN